MILRRAVIQDNNRIPALIEDLTMLKKLRVEIGVFGEGKSTGVSQQGQSVEVENDSFILMIARVHEYGMTIEPKNAQYLTIPLPAAKGTSPSDHDDLFVPHGTRVLARKSGKDSFEPMFALVDSVTIPERSFMRSTYDEKKKELELNLQKLIGSLLEGKLTPKNLYERIGIWMVSQVQNKIRDIQSPPNAPATKANKGSDNPLIDTGRLIQSITYRVVKD